ncbi:cyclin-like protein [Chytridium lagenaria]|nr:cyclin-like protein [Chytridium lagenaria]
MEPKRLSLLEQEEQWLFLDAAFTQTPSILKNMTPSQEAWKRAKGCKFIKDIGVKLELPCETTAMARLFYQRFFMRNAFPTRENEDPHPFMLGSTALHLACKLTSITRKVDFIIHYARIESKKATHPNIEKSGIRLLATDKEAIRWKEGIFYYEGELCFTLNFDFAVKFPHGYAIEIFQKCTAPIIQHYEAMKHSDFVVYEQYSKVLRKLRFSLAKFYDDCMSTTLPLRYDGKHLAIVILYAVAKTVQEWGKKLQGISPTVRKFIENPFPTTDGKSIFDTDPYTGKGPCLLNKETLDCELI